MWCFSGIRIAFGETQQALEPSRFGVVEFYSRQPTDRVIGSFFYW